ncbi:MAG: ABC transporter permease [Chloroflexi bacterium]|nr:ABC transporter permease [Chloroflexota bacterium]
MQPLTMPGLIARRLASDWKLLLSIFLGIMVATVLIAGAPIYVNALDRQGANTAIDNASDSFLNVFVHGPNITLDDVGIARANASLQGALDEHLDGAVRGGSKQIRTPIYLIGLPNRPLPSNASRIGDPTRSAQVSQGYAYNIADIDEHVDYLDGSPAGDTTSQGPLGPVVEAVVGRRTALIFDLAVGDILEMAPTLSNRSRVSLQIVGIVEPKDPQEEFWHGAAQVIFEPLPLEPTQSEEFEVDPEEPPIPIFVTERAMIDGIGNAFPNTLITANWIIFLERERLKQWGTSDLLDRINAVDAALSQAVPGSALFTGIRSLVPEYEQRSFFSRVPLALLLAVMVITVLYYLSMIVSYLVLSREDDVALLRSRGVTSLQMLRLYALEGGALTLIAVAVAPLLAYGAVAGAGKLPAFEDITGGSMLPVEFAWLPFAVAAATGAVGLTIFLVPALLGARSSLVMHKLRSSRPPSVPLFQRYYLDIGLLVLGGIVFWELQDRGQIVSGGLFDDVQVNEALLLAPVLLLVAVALLFMRFFPLFVRFISGESAAILHLVAGAALISLASGIVLRELNDGDSFGWLVPVLLIAAAGGLYRATQRVDRMHHVIAGLALQALAVAIFVYREPLEPSELSFIPTTALIALVPAQVLFLVFQRLVGAAPVWIALALWHMARNPLQYSWLVLLLVLVTGLGILSTTVGGTLVRSYEDRIKYDVGADLRVSGLPQNFVGRSRDELKEIYQTIPGVTSVSLGYRGDGVVGATSGGNRFQLLAVESEDFPYLAWYRDDFSARPLPGVMKRLLPQELNAPVKIPEDARTLGLWVKPGDEYAGLFLWGILSDVHGGISTVTFGEMGGPEWKYLSVEIPVRIDQPLRLESLQIFERVFGPSGTAGTMLMDDIQVTVGPEREVVVLDDFEGESKWTALATSMISSDRVVASGQDVHNGERSGVFTFGKDTDRGIRGFYRSPTGGPLPVVVSSSFMGQSAAGLGDRLILGFQGRLIPVVIREVVEYFPTLNPRTAGFVLVDLEALVRHVNVVSPIGGAIAPNELFIAEASGSGTSVRDTVIGLIGSDHLVRHRDSLLESVRLDPLVTAGWKAMVFVSLVVILFTAGLGYITYLLEYAGRSRSEMGFLRSLGLSRKQVTGLLSLEHLVIVFIGLGLGTWAGFQMSDLMVSSVAVTETGDHVVPPFVRVTDWKVLTAVYAGLLGIFLGALYVLTRSMAGLDLHKIARVEGS